MVGIGYGQAEDCLPTASMPSMERTISMYLSLLQTKNTSQKTFNSDLETLLRSTILHKITYQIATSGMWTMFI